MFRKKYTHRPTTKRVFTLEGESTEKCEDADLLSPDTYSPQTAGLEDRDEEDDDESPMISDSEMVHVPVIQDISPDNDCQGMEVQCEVEVTSTPLNPQLSEEDAVPLSTYEVPDHVEREAEYDKDKATGTPTKESNTEYIISCQPVMTIKDFERNLNVEKNNETLKQDIAEPFELQSNTPSRSQVKSSPQNLPEKETMKDKHNTPKHSKQMLTLPPLCASTPRNPSGLSITRRELITDIIDFDASPVIVKQHKALDIRVASKTRTTSEPTISAQNAKIVQNVRITKTSSFRENIPPVIKQSDRKTTDALQAVTKDDLLDQISLNNDKIEKDAVISQVGLEDNLVSQGDSSERNWKGDLINKEDLLVRNKSLSKTLRKGSSTSATTESEGDPSTTSSKKLKLSKEALGLMEQNRKMSSLLMTDSDSYLTCASSSRSLRPKKSESESSDKTLTRSRVNLNKRKKKRKLSQKPSKSQTALNPLTSESETNVYNEQLSKRQSGPKHQRQRKSLVATVDQNSGPINVPLLTSPESGPSFRLKNRPKAPTVTSPESGPCVRNTSRNKLQSQGVEVFSISSSELETSPNLKRKKNQKNRQTFSNLFTYSTYDKSNQKNHSVKSRVNAKENKTKNLTKPSSNKKKMDNVKLSGKNRERLSTNTNQSINQSLISTSTSVSDDHRRSNSQNSKHFIGSLKHLTMMKPDFSPRVQRKSKELFTRGKKAKRSSLSKTVTDTPVTRKKSISKVSQKKTSQPSVSRSKKNNMKEKEIIRNEDLDNEIEEIGRHENLNIEGFHDKELQRITNLWSHHYQNLKKKWSKNSKRNKNMKWVYIGQFPDDYEDSQN